MMRMLPLFFFLLPALAAAQAHDACSMAFPLTVGQRVAGQTNKEAGISQGETPAGQPVTCIKSFENDLWYRFTGNAAYQWYEIVVEPLECSSPAGLQALLIASADCDPAHFQYVGCANPYENTNLRLILRDVRHGAPYLVQVDGYDGTQCDFAITLIAHPEPFGDFAALQCDYHRPEATREMNARLSLINNSVRLEWEDDGMGEVTGFLVERWHASPNGSHGAVTGRVAPSQRVMGGMIPYTWTDAGGGWQNGDTVCYRLVRVLPSGPEYSDLMCMRVEGMITSLFITPPAITPESPESVTAQYDNHQRQDITFELLDSQMKPLKSLTRAKEPKGLSSISVNMSAFPAGTYYLRTTVKEGAFLHAFEWKGQ